MIARDAAYQPESKRGIVVFDTRYGNTEKIARSLEIGLRRAGMTTSCLNVKEANPLSLKEYDLIAVGAPTEWRSASKPMKSFLESLKSVDLSGKHGFAFDTRLTRPLSGSAASLIEKELGSRRIQIVAQRESAVVFLESGSISGARLKEGEAEKFEEIGLQLGREFLKVVVATGEAVSAR